MSYNDEDYELLNIKTLGYLSSRNGNIKDYSNKYKNFRNPGSFTVQKYLDKYAHFSYQLSTSNRYYFNKDKKKRDLLFNISRVTISRDLNWKSSHKYKPNLSDFSIFSISTNN